MLTAGEIKVIIDKLVTKSPAVAMQIYCQNAQFQMKKYFIFLWEFKHGKMKSCVRMKNTLCNSHARNN